MSRQSSPFSSGLYRTSVSSVELSLSPSIKDTKEPITPPVTLQCSNPVSESFAQRYRDLAHIRVRRRGKVKGLVETWEREQGRRDSVSSKEGSVDEEAVFASDTESGSEAGVEEPVILRDEPLPVNELPSSSLSWADSTIVASDPLPPHTSINAVDEEEPSIEELLSCSTTLEGALAWEADIGLGETMKHVPTSTTPDPSVTSRIVPPELGTTIERTDLTKSRPVLDGGASSRHRNARSQNRVVTAIFTDAEEHCGGMNHAMGIVEVADDPSVQHKTSERVAGMVDADVQVSDTPLGAIGIPGNDRADIICALETSLASTRTELQVFKARLEAVEACLIRFEAVLPRNPVQSNFCLQQSPGELSKRDAQISTDDFGPGRTPGVMAFDKFHELDWRNITRAARAGIMSWICPYTSPLVHRYRIYCAKLPQDTHSLLRASNLRLSSVVAFPLLLCVALLRRVGLNRWLRRP
ncbi:hypothetical protein ID866_7821 [Astraeus odoratus]|nr:hypothetical protein ID866_7821 [Astraeus odoratus]